MKPSRRAAALGLAAFASGAIALDTVLARFALREVHPIEIAFFRNLFAMLFFLPWLHAAGRSALGSRLMPLHVLRALLKVAGMIAFFYAIALLPVSLVTAIGFTTPLFIVAGSALVLREVVTRRQLIGIALGFAGVLVVVRPDGGALGPGIALAIAAAIALAAVGILMKYLSDRETSATIVSLNLVISVPIGLLIALPFWTTPSLPILGILLVQGLLGLLAQLATSRALSLADASHVAPIEFFRLPFVATFGYLMIGEVADAWTLLGGLVIFAATMISLNRRRHVPLE